MPLPRTWLTLTAAPHRPMFFGGVVQLVAVMPFWLLELAARAGWGWPQPATVIPAAWAHALLLLYATFPFFIFGFLMTTYPRWMRGEEVPRRRYLSAFLLLAGGALLFHLGLFLGKGWLSAAFVLLLAGWARALHALLWVYFHVATRDKRYETWLNVALACGWLGLFSAFLWLLGGPWPLLDFALQAGVWLFLLPVFFTVAHRMLPYFTVNAIPGYRPFHPRWSLPLMGLCVAGHAALELAGLAQWLFLFDLPFGAAALYHSLRWWPRGVFGNRLLAVLHLALAWLGPALLFSALQSALLLANGTQPFGRAPLHMLLIGFAAAMVVAMATRVSQGHSGRPLVAGPLAWATFLALQGVAALRVAADLVGNGALLPWAALGWLAVLLPWCLRYGWIYLTPRVDGQPG